eukprot:g756.t1
MCECIDRCTSRECNRLYLLVCNVVLMVLGFTQMICASWVTDHEMLVMHFPDAKLQTTLAALLGALAMVAAVIGCCATFGRQSGLMMAFSCLMVGIFAIQTMVGIFLLNKSTEVELNTYADRELRDAYLLLVAEVNDKGPKAEDAKATLQRISQSGTCCGYDSRTAPEELVYDFVEMCSAYPAGRVCKAEFLLQVADAVRPWAIAMLSVSSIDFFFLFLVTCFLIYRFDCNCRLSALIPLEKNHKLKVGKWESTFV